MGPTYNQAPPAYLLANHLEMLSGDMHSVDWHDGTTDVPELTGTVTGYNPFNIKAIMYQTYLNGSPYAGVSAYDPSEELTATEEALAEYLDVVEGWDPAVEWGTVVDAVKTKADTVFLDATLISNEVTAYQNRTAARHSRDLASAVNALFRDGASEGSAVPIALALQRAERARELEDYEAKLVASQRDARNTFIDNQTRVQLTNLSSKRATQQNIYGLQAEINTRKIVAGKEYIAEELQYLMQDSTFDLDLFAHGGSMIGAISGAPNLAPGPSKAQTALSAGLGILGIVAPIFFGL